MTAAYNQMLLLLSLCDVMRALLPVLRPRTVCILLCEKAQMGESLSLSAFFICIEQADIG